MYWFDEICKSCDGFSDWYTKACANAITTNCYVSEAILLREDNTLEDLAYLTLWALSVPERTPHSDPNKALIRDAHALADKLGVSWQAARDLATAIAL